MSWLSRTVKRNRHTLKKVAAIAAPVALVGTGGAAAPALGAGAGGGFFGSLTKGFSGLTSFLGKSGNKSEAPPPVESGIVSAPQGTASFVGTSKLSTPTILIIGGGIFVLLFGWKFIRRIVK